ncbi:hypothetical protein MtrunA17_Chr5g0394451 [Medicago truncatula]|uniref:Uncharacterized protein n=1 Tax=Medicago truncatula TaxID=3880 RepID=A0A396HR58_MEDTR|nr:hypothetical protein MtrunA17_Chr5g0394451 [Medicago truncatula]
MTWLHPVAVKQVDIHGTVASFAVSGWLVTLLPFPFLHAQDQVSTTIFGSLQVLQLIALLSEFPEHYFLQHLIW